MTDNKWSRIVSNLRKELFLMVREASSIKKYSNGLQSEAEYLKLDFLKYSLEKQRKNIACQRGLATVFKDKKMMRTSLFASAAALILGGLITKDKYAALRAGLSGFDGAVQGFGDAKWAVLLQKDLAIVPYDAIQGRGTWVTLESLIESINELEVEISRGKQLGNLDGIIRRVQQSTKLISIFKSE